MKTRLFTLALALSFAVSLSAQYCGNSGSAICTPNGSVDTPGVFDNDNIACIVRGQTSNAVAHFKNYTIFHYNGIVITIDSLRFDSIAQLPAGLCWSTNNARNVFSTGEEGCMKFSGTTNAPAGQYKLIGFVTAYTSIGVIGPNLSGESIGLKAYLRVINNAGSVCPPIDTTQTNPYNPPLANYDSLAVIQGKVFFDLNQNGTPDAGEKGIANQWIDIGAYRAITNALGNYYAYVPPGNYNIRPSLTGLPAQLSFQPDSIDVSADSMKVTYANNNFGVIIPPNFCQGDLSIYRQGRHRGLGSTIRYFCCSQIICPLRPPARI